MILTEDDREPPIWENGIDRVADLAILPDHGDTWDASIKSVQLADDW